MVDRHFHDLVYNGKALSEFGVHLTGSGTFNSPEKDYETIEIPGRNGDLHISNNRFKNVEVTYKAFIAGEDLVTDPGTDFSFKMEAFRSWVLSCDGYQRLEDTYHPNEYREALFKGPISFDALFLRAGEFDITFDCKPQRYLKSGEEVRTFKKSGTIYNPTLFASKPLLRVYGTDTLTINNVIISLSSEYTGEYMVIDCEIQDAYYGTTNCNPYLNLVDGEFFTLAPGINEISIGPGIKKLEIIPKWWII